MYICVTRPTATANNKINFSTGNSIFKGLSVLNSLLFYPSHSSSLFQTFVSFSLFYTLNHLTIRAQIIARDAYFVMGKRDSFKAKKSLFVSYVMNAQEMRNVLFYFPLFVGTEFSNVLNCTLFLALYMIHRLNNPIK